MEAKHIEELRQNYRFIVNNVGDAEALCDELLSQGVFDENYVDKILLKQPAPKEQTKELLYLLKFKGPLAYSKFIVALESSGNKHVADKLMKPDIMPEPAPPRPIQPSSVQPSQGQPTPVQPTPVQSTSVQPSDNEDAFDSWPSNKCKRRKCSEEEKMRLLSDETVYKITEFPEKGFVLRLKCLPQSCKEVGHCFDNCNTDLNSVMTFLDSQIQAGKCTTKLGNKTAAEYETNIREIIQTNNQKLEKAGYFMMFFLSFGAPEAGCGQLFDINKKCVNVRSMIQTVKDCEALKNKPKIFITITIPDKIVQVSEPSEDRTVTDAGIDSSSTNEDDLFVLHVSHGQQGPWFSNQMWFMKAFCDVLYANSYNLHFLELIEKVNQLMSNAVVDKENKTRGHVGEVKVVQKDTRKRLYFFPGVQAAQQATS